MTDVNYITYLKCNFTLIDIIQNTYRYDKQIRCMTLLLGCSYANILKNIFFLLNNFHDHCKYFTNHKNLNSYKYDCTIELLKTIPFLTSLVIHMGGALEALDKTHKRPVENNHIKQFILNTLLKELQNEKILKLLTLSQINQLNVDEKLLKILSYITEWDVDLNIGMNICNINSESHISLWKDLSNVYNNTHKDESNIKLYNYMNYKIVKFSQWAIQEKYVNLGFIFNTANNKTSVPALQESTEEEYFQDPTNTSTQLMNEETIGEYFQDPTNTSTQMMNEETIGEYFQDPTNTSTQMMNEETIGEYFQDPTNTSTQMMNEETIGEYFQDPTNTSTQMMNEETIGEYFQDPTNTSTQLMNEETIGEYFQDPTNTSTQLMNEETIGEYFQDPTNTSTQMMNEETIGEKFIFEETIINRQTRDTSSWINIEH
ncbi:uncharacterized protein LOC126900037 isoform X2 [Daktulosphaira vitifoliae]|uniref:uncharacterized protein LOC126900037 isoform X2 n=1 Tax=Daktulosphaira vitifoliae TaxID=58002 RepID=UPI0021AA1397|nr:uncharacterized protein LOC126900037 isoform X2 [Daktulosphaira vitifoliae]